MRAVNAAPPAIAFFHGGGFVLGDLDSQDGLARRLTNRTGSAVVSVDYPLAPEHKYPAAPDAAFAATDWVSRRGEEIGVDRTRIAVAGNSAGGNLAAVVAIKARDAGAPHIAFQLLIYPDLDLRRSNKSIRDFAGRYGNVSRTRLLDSAVDTQLNRYDGMIHEFLPGPSTPPTKPWTTSPRPSVGVTPDLRRDLSRAHRRLSRP